METEGLREVLVSPEGSQVAAGTHQAPNRGCWNSETYAVTRREFLYITKRWGVHPTVDAFATAEDAQCPVVGIQGAPMVEMLQASHGGASFSG